MSRRFGALCLLLAGLLALAMLHPVVAAVPAFLAIAAAAAMITIG